MRLLQKMVLLPLFCSALLSGCGTLVDLIYTPTPKPDPGLLRCLDAPPIPDPATADQQAVSLYMIGLYFAYLDCKGSLEAVRALLETQSAE